MIDILIIRHFSKCTSIQEMGKTLLDTIRWKKQIRHNQVEKTKKDTIKSLCLDEKLNHQNTDYVLH